jgi:uncharacterized coiled-coil protein SlyX
LQDPPYDTDIVLFDTTSLNSTDPVCVNTFLTVDGPIDPSMGALTLRFGVNFVDTTESIVIYGVGLMTVLDPDSPVAQLEDDVAQLEDDVAQLEDDVAQLEDYVAQLEDDVAQLEDGVEQLEDDVAQLNKSIERIAAVLIDHGVRLDNLDNDLDRLTNIVNKHTHIYMTGKGVGHNNVKAASSTYTLDLETLAPKQINKKLKWSSKKGLLVKPRFVTVGIQRQNQQGFDSRESSEAFGYYKTPLLQNLWVEVGEK